MARQKHGRGRVGLKDVKVETVISMQHGMAWALGEIEPILVLSA